MIYSPASPGCKARPFAYLRSSLIHVAAQGRLLEAGIPRVWPPLYDSDGSNDCTYHDLLSRCCGCSLADGPQHVLAVQELLVQVELSTWHRVQQNKADLQVKRKMHTRRLDEPGVISSSACALSVSEPDQGLHPPSAAAGPCGAWSDPPIWSQAGAGDAA